MTGKVEKMDGRSSEDAARTFVASLPKAARWKRIPIIRHARAIWATIEIARHYDTWLAMGYFPTGAHLDYAARDAIWRGDL